MKTPRSGQSGFVWFPVLLGVLAILAVSGGAYWYQQQKPSVQTPATQLISDEQALTLAQNAVTKDLGKSTIALDCLTFAPSKDELYITYTTVRKAQCISPLSDPPMIPVVRVDRNLVKSFLRR